MFSSIRKLMCMCVCLFSCLNVARADKPSDQLKNFEESKLRFSVTNIDSSNDLGQGFEISSLGNKTSYLGDKQIKERSELAFKFNPNKINTDGCDVCSKEKASILFTIGDNSPQSIDNVNSIVSLMTTRESELFSYHSNGTSDGYEALDTKFLGGVSVGSKDIRLNAQAGLGGRIEVGQTKGPMELSGVGSLSLDVGEFAKATARKEYSLSPTSGDLRDVESINIDVVPGKYIGNDKRNFHVGFELRNEKFIPENGTEKFDTKYGGLKAGFQF